MLSKRKKTLLAESDLVFEELRAALVRAAVT
jgi:hypothetical protein